MAKVYDALRRAEEERKRRVTAGETPLTPPAAPGEGGPPSQVSFFEAAPAPSARGRASFLRRLWPARRRPQPGESAFEGNKRRITLLQPESFVAEQFRTLR